MNACSGRYRTDPTSSRAFPNTAACRRRFPRQQQTEFLRCEVRGRAMVDGADEISACESDRLGFEGLSVIPP